MIERRATEVGTTDSALLSVVPLFVGAVPSSMGETHSHRRSVMQFFSLTIFHCVCTVEM